MKISFYMVILIEAHNIEDEVLHNYKLSQWCRKMLL